MGRGTAHENGCLNEVRVKNARIFVRVEGRGGGVHLYYLKKTKKTGISARAPKKFGAKSFTKKKGG